MMSDDGVQVERSWPTEWELRYPSQRKPRHKLGRGHRVGGWRVDRLLDLASYAIVCVGCGKRRRINESKLLAGSIGCCAKCEKAERTRKALERRRKLVGTVVNGWQYIDAAPVRGSRNAFRVACVLCGRECDRNTYHIRRTQCVCRSGDRASAARVEGRLAAERRRAEVGGVTLDTPWAEDPMARELVAEHGAMTLEQIADAYGVRRQAVFEVEERALRKLAARCRFDPRFTGMADVWEHVSARVPTHWERAIDLLSSESDAVPSTNEPKPQRRRRLRMHCTRCWKRKGPTARHQWCAECGRKGREYMRERSSEAAA